jgi:hypothetical protein
MHGREIDDKPVIAYAQTTGVVPAASDCHEKLMFAAEIHRCDNIRHINATRDETRSSVDHPIIDFASLVVTRVIWLDQLSAQTLR